MLVQNPDGAPILATVSAEEKVPAEHEPPASDKGTLVAAPGRAGVFVAPAVAAKIEAS